MRKLISKISGLLSIMLFWSLVSFAGEDPRLKDPRSGNILAKNPFVCGSDGILNVCEPYIAQPSSTKVDLGKAVPVEADIVECLGLRKEILPDGVIPWDIKEIGDKTEKLVDKIVADVLTHEIYDQDNYLLYVIYKLTKACEGSEERAIKIYDEKKGWNMDNYVKEKGYVCYHASVLLQLADMTFGNDNYMIVNRKGNHQFNLRKRLDSGQWEFVDAYNYRWAPVKEESVQRCLTFQPDGLVVDPKQGDWVPSDINDPAFISDLPGATTD